MKKIELKFLNFQLKRGGPAERFCLKGEGCVYKKKFESIFVAQQTEYVSTLMVFEESRSVENRLQRCYRNVRVGKFVQDVFFFSRMPNVWPCNSAVISTHKCLKLTLNPVLP